MNGVVGHPTSEHFADGSPDGLGRIGGAIEGTNPVLCIVSAQFEQDDRAARHVLDEVFEKRLPSMFVVEAFEDVSSDSRADPNFSDLQTRIEIDIEYLDTVIHRIRLDHGECAFQRAPP